MPDSAAKMGPALPKGDGNGLAAIAEQDVGDAFADFDEAGEG